MACWLLTCFAATAYFLPGSHAISCHVGRLESHLGPSCTAKELENYTDTLTWDVSCPSTSTECVTEAYTYGIRNGCSVQALSAYCNAKVPPVDACEAGEMAYNLLTTGIGYGCDRCSEDSCNPSWYSYFHPNCQDAYFPEYSEDYCRIRRDCPSAMEHPNLGCAMEANDCEGCIELSTAECKFGWKPIASKTAEGCGTLWCCASTLFGTCCEIDVVVWAILFVIAVCLVILASCGCCGCCPLYRFLCCARCNVGCCIPKSHFGILVASHQGSEVVVGKPA